MRTPTTMPSASNHRPKVTVLTSTQPATSASLWRRFMGMAYELFLLIALILGYAFVFTGLTAWKDETSQVYRHAAQMSFFVILGLYFVWCWTQGRATLPMQTMQMTLVRASDGQPLGYREALLRYLLAWPSYLTAVGVIWILFDKDHQSLHDRLSGTRLVETPGPRQRRAA